MNDIKQLEERIAQLTELIASTSDTIKKAKEIIKAAEQERDRLCDQVNEGEPKFERVKEKEKYYCITDFCRCFEVVNETEEHCSLDETAYSNNNYFHTAQRAKEVVDKINLLLKLERLHDTFCPDYVPDWNDKDKVKYYVFKNKFISISRWDIGYVSTSDISDVYFPTEEIAQKVCNILNAEERSKDV